MKQEGFTHIGRTAATGMPQNRPEAGSNAGRAGAVASPGDTAKVQAFLASHTPKAVDEAAVLRASQLGAGLTVEYDYRFPKDERGNSLPMVTLVRGVGVSGTNEARNAAAAALRRLETQADARDIEGWLAELSVIVAKRMDDEFTENLRLEAYASRLRRYPADVARHAVLGHSWRFWPSWSELEAVCDQLVAPRRAMIRALEQHHATEPERAGQRITAERAAEIMREVFGDRGGDAA